jgi:septal ring factor EnvC (AmiA/AmiB activator)
MKILNKTLVAVSLCLITAGSAFASHGNDRSWRHDNILQRLERQQHRIDRGVKHHQLTHKEEKRLRRQQRKIRRMARRFYRDGYLSKKEHRLLNRQLRASSRQIKRLKHNDLEPYVNLHHRYCHKDYARRL